MEKVHKNIIISAFEDDRYPGWKSIAATLVENGQCVVAGTHCIWVGGIGNYIDAKPAEDYIDCMLYKFDAEKFMKSKMYKELKRTYLISVKESITKLAKSIQSDQDKLKELMDEATKLSQ